MGKTSAIAATLALAGAALLIVACGGGGQKQDGPGPPRETQAIEEPEATARTVEFTTLAVFESPAEATGEATTARVTVGPSDTGELKVSFAESEVGGIGPQWQSAGWAAVALSSLLLGIDPRQYEFTFDPGLGLVDGPSAGGVSTIAVLAAILGDDVREEAAMTGTVNPDGTIGPVGGIPHKIQGAADAGKSLVVIPASQRFDTDINTGQAVDLVDLGTSLGVEVQPVSTVYEAYELLTGNPLPRPAGAGSPEMPADAFSKLKAAATEWLGRYQAALNRFLALPDTLGYEQDILIADQMATDAGNALRQGLAAVAYERAFSAASIAEGALQAVALAEAYLTGGVPALVAEVQALATVETRRDATLERLEAETPRSATDVLALTDAYSNVAIAFGLINDASALVQFLQEAELTEDEALGIIFSIATNYSQADFFLDAAENNLVYGLGFGQAPAPDPEVITAIAETLRRAADANLAVVDSTIIEPRAEAYGVTPEEFRNFLLSTDADYGAALGTANSIDYFRSTITEEPQASIAVLGSSLSAWAESAVVVAKYYSLKAEFDENFNIVSFGRERSLSDMLDLAEERAQELITLVGEEEPVSSLYYHENARSYREGTSEDKIAALFYNWQAAILAEALAYFNGTFDSAISDVGASPLWEWGAASVAPAGDGDSEPGSGETTPTSTPTPD
ncbi:MAG: S16 family serine protease [Dehalococcoidia bacterium]|nr:S16 family serine protease [Dehalococcoidia bacterium]